MRIRPCCVCPTGLNFSNGIPCPQEGNDKIQRAWDSINIMRDFNLVAEQAPNRYLQGWTFGSAKSS